MLQDSDSHRQPLRVKSRGGEGDAVEGEVSAVAFVAFSTGSEKRGAGSHWKGQVSVDAKAGAAETADRVEGSLPVRGL